MLKSFMKIGHRGAMGYCEENTLFCFEKAIELGCDMIEFDVHIFNNEIVVVHDPPKKGREYPTLKSVIDLVDKRVKINIELKGKSTAEPVAKLLKKYTQKKWTCDDFFVSSFSAKELKDFRKINPCVFLGFIVKEKKIDIVNIAKDIGVYSVNLSFKLVNRNLIDKLHNQGFNVFIWTVNKKRDIEKVISLGVDGIISDYPDRI